MGSCQAGLHRRGFRPNVAARPSSSSVTVEDASGTDADRTTMSSGPLKPTEMNVGLTATPVAVYSPTVLARVSTMNRLFPDNVMPRGLAIPEMNKGLIGAPVAAAYSPIVPLPAFDS